jgi:anti-sigma B factor antagonist
VNGRPFDVHVTEQSEYVVVQVAGEIDLVTAPVLQRHLDTATASNRPTVVIDLSATTFLDARGVGVLVATRKQVAQAGSRLVLRRPPPLVRRVLELLDQLDGLPIEE